MSQPAPTPEPEPKSAPEQAPAKSDRKPRRRWLHGLLVWGSSTVLMVMLAGLVGLYLILGKELTVPQGLRDQLTQRINASIEGAQLDFGDVAVMLEQDWVPRVVLRNLGVRDARGERLAVVSEVQSTMALRPLLRGAVQPSRIRLSGATVRLRRSAEGNVGLAVGDSPETVEEAPSFAALIQQMDQFLLQDHFTSLKGVEADNLTIQYEDARARRGWTVDGGRIDLIRDHDDLQLRGDFVLLGNRGFATTLAANYSGRIGETTAEFGVTFDDMPARDIAGQSPALAWLEALDAPISGALRASVEEDGELGPLNATLQIGQGALQPTDATKPIPFSRASAYFTYDPKQQTMQVDEVFVDSKWVRARVEGKAVLVGLEQGWPSELLSQFRITELSANPDALYADPIEIEGATMETRLKLDPFELTLGEMSLTDQGQRLVLRGRAAAKPEGWVVALDGRMDGLTPQRLLQLWPERIKEPTRNWIRDNVKTAKLSDIQLAVRSIPKSRPDLFLGFDFNDMETQFIKGVPHIQGGSGHGSLYDNRFVIAASEGHITAATGGRVDVAGTSFTISDVSLKQSPAIVRLRARSTVTAALSLLDSKPFEFLEKAGQPVTLADGRADIKGTLDFQLKRKVTPEDVRYDIAAVARDVRSETLVKGRVLAAPKLDITVKTGTLRISGDGRIGRVPVSGAWSTGLGKDSGGKSQLKGKIELSERFADEFRIGLPPGSVSGAGQGDIVIDFARGQPGRFRLTSGLAGLGLSLKPLGWSLSRNGRGTLEVAGSLGTPPRIDKLAIDAGGLVANGTVTLKPSGQLERASFARVRVGSWLNAPVDLIGRGANATPAVRVIGGTIDMRQTSLGGGGGSGGSSATKGGPIDLALDRLQISDGISLTNFRADLDMSNGADGTFTGAVNGGAAVSGVVIPQGGRSAFRIRSENAGGVLKSAGLLKNARRGQMDLVLIPASARGSYNGKLTVEQLRLKDAPALAALLNTLSVVGILEQLDGEGIHFGTVEADFQLTPDRVILQEGSAVGASMGISMDGYYYLESGQMDMQGVFSPLYLVNAIGGIFTRRGEGLIGFNYELDGPASAPRVSVNPLSLLTPGMFRELFRKPPPKVQR
ncbi:MAG: AsmA-like C-terminal region-containing protein [Roseovarius sp.]